MLGFGDVLTAASLHLPGYVKKEIRPEAPLCCITVIDG